MNWHYVQAGQQMGPVSDSDLENLYRSGVIANDTLIWREGMSGWEQYATIKGGGGNVAVAAPPVMAGSVVCAECGKVFPPDEVIKHGNSYVCATCKPTFVQKLREGAAINYVREYAGFGIRFGAKFVDGIILRFVGFVTGLVVGAIWKPANPFVSAIVLGAVGMVISAIYNTIFIGKFGATPGKMAAKIRVINADGSAVSYGKALARYGAEILSAIILCIGYLMVGFDSERRALHDRICGTRVIKVTTR